MEEGGGGEKWWGQCGDRYGLASRNRDMEEGGGGEKWWGQCGDRYGAG